MSSTNHQMVLMFADVCGNVSLFERMVDTEALYAVDRCLKRITRAADSFAGKVVESAGSELLLVFDAAEEACNAAVEIQQRIADLPPVSGHKLGVRIGLHLGEVKANGEQLRGPAITTAARIAGNAQSGQILCSAAMLAALPPLTTITSLPSPNPVRVEEAGVPLTVTQIYWPAPGGHETPSATYRHAANDEPHQSDRICLRHSGKAFLLDGKSPVLTIGRDLSNELVIEDRKASRTHGRVEKRGAGFYLVDASSNGTFIRQVGQREMMLRRGEILLAGSGRISFGCTLGDPAAEVVEFEYLT